MKNLLIYFSILLLACSSCRMKDERAEGMGNMQDSVIKARPSDEDSIVTK